MVGISLYKSETLRVEFYKFGWILSSTVWWWRWRWWREETETTHKAPSLGSTALQSHVVQLHSVIIISISLSSSQSYYQHFLPSEVTIHNPGPISPKFSRQLWIIITSSTALGWQSFDSIDIHHHFLYCYAGIIQCFTEPYTASLSGAGTGAGAPRIHL